MKVILKRENTKKYLCPECNSIIEIKDSEFTVKREYPPFYFLGLADFQEDTRIKTRICDCPICGGTIKKRK